jgi:UDP-N-acetylmuramoyl-L-alanyl-D-glutamate--2,6-diaminopimelate ligase
VKLEAGIDGLRFGISWEGRTYDVVSSMAGLFNVHNLLAAFGAGVTLGLDPAFIAESFRASPAVAGRFEKVDAGQPFLVVVDYAHTDDALRNAIGAARAVTKGRVITLFGCGGDRDRAKRPLMGQAAGELSDVVVLTSDNPRSEDPLDIMNDAMVGIGRTDCVRYAEPDRAVAIRLAIAEARPGDVVLLAGKGHETTQTFRDRVVQFDDREAARAALKSLGFDREAKR